MKPSACGIAQALLAVLLAATADPALAQPQVVVAGPPASGPLRHLTPTFSIGTSGFSPSDSIRSVRLQIGTQSDLGGVLVADTTVSPAPSTVRLHRPLPQDTPLYWRATVRTESGLEVRSATVGPRVTVPWLTLLFPNEPNGTTVAGRQPMFVWASATIDAPPGPWRFDFTIVDAATGQVVIAQTVDDTSFIAPTPLEANTPYRWRLTSRLDAGASTTTESAATFVIADTDAPLATVLYQSFPNPFPTPAAQSACIWFDLRQPTSVTLEIFDLRGSLVRRIVPARGFGPLFPAGRYGREPGQTDSGCDPRFAWDGFGEDGRAVPAGVYLLRMRAGDREMVRKILFRGQ